jgi:hypothetical protein
VPKRSNQFQRLIVSIHHALAEVSAVVEESRELRDRVTGTLREVDIVIESAVGDYPVFVCVECCDRSRPATVEWVEQQHGKHATLPTNKLILVSRSGFTQSALDKARSHNIETLATADAVAVEWTTVVHRVHRVVVDTTSVVLMLFPCLQPRPKDAACRPLPFDDILISPEDAWRVPVSRFVDTLLNHPPIRSRTVEAIAADADAGWIVSFPVAAGSFVETVKGARRSLGGLGLVVLTKRRIVPFDLSPIGFGAHQVASGGAQSEIGDLLLTVLEREDAAPTAVLLRRLGEFTNAETIPGRPVSRAELAPNEAMAALMGRFNETA